MLDASIARKTGTYRNHTQSFSSLWPRRRIELCAHFPFPPSSRQPLPSDLKGSRQPSTPAHQYNGALHSFKGLSPIFDLLTPLCFEDLADLTLADEYVFSKVVDIASREHSYTLSGAE